MADAMRYTHHEVVDGKLTPVTRAYALHAGTGTAQITGSGSVTFGGVTGPTNLRTAGDFKVDRDGDFVLDRVRVVSTVGSIELKADNIELKNGTELVTLANRRGNGFYDAGRHHTDATIRVEAANDLTLNQVRIISGGSYLVLKSGDHASLKSTDIALDHRGASNASGVSAQRNLTLDRVAINIDRVGTRFQLLAGQDLDLVDTSIQQRQGDFVASAQGDLSWRGDQSMLASVEDATLEAQGALLSLTDLKVNLDASAAVAKSAFSVTSTGDLTLARVEITEGANAVEDTEFDLSLSATGAVTAEDVAIDLRHAAISIASTASSVSTTGGLSADVGEGDFRVNAETTVRLAQLNLAGFAGDSSTVEVKATQNLRIDSLLGSLTRLTDGLQLSSKTGQVDITLADLAVGAGALKCPDCRVFAWPVLKTKRWYCLQARCEWPPRELSPW